MQTEIANRTILGAQTFTTWLCLAAAFCLYVKHLDAGAALFIGIACPSPSQALGSKKQAEEATGGGAK